ncbi:MAG: hypothetical protein V2A73_20695 [Pseudomonadota bacterium]
MLASFAFVSSSRRLPRTSIRGASSGQVIEQIEKATLLGSLGRRVLSFEYPHSMYRVDFLPQHCQGFEQSLEALTLDPNRFGDDLRLHPSRRIGLDRSHRHSLVDTTRSGASAVRLTLQARH